MLVDHEVIVSILGRRAWLLTIVLMVKCSVVSFGSWSRCVDHGHRGSRKGLSATVEEVVVVLLTWKRLGVVERLLAVVWVCGLSLGSLWAEALMWRLAVTSATTVEMDGRGEGLHISVLDVAAMVEESAASSRLVCRAHWSWSSTGVRMHRARLSGQTEGEVASVILRMVLRTTIHEHRGATWSSTGAAGAVHGTAIRVSHHVGRYMVSIAIHLLRHIVLTQAWRCGTKGMVADWRSRNAFRGAFLVRVAKSWVFLRHSGLRLRLVHFRLSLARSRSPLGCSLRGSALQWFLNELLGRK